MGLVQRVVQEEEEQQQVGEWEREGQQLVAEQEKGEQQVAPPEAGEQSEQGGDEAQVHPDASRLLRTMTAAGMAK